VPAAAVIPEWLALFGMIGRKGCVDGIKENLLNSLKMCYFLNIILEWILRYKIGISNDKM